MAGELVERLRASEALNNRYAWERDKAREERDAAERRSEAHWRPRLEAAQAANTALTAKVALLTEALRPFAEAADSIDDNEGDRIEMWEHPASMQVTAADFRRARSADREGEDGR